MASDRFEHTEDVDSELAASAEASEADTTLLPEDSVESPREFPLAADDYGVTAAEEVRDEPLTQRLGRELPDVSPRHRPTDPDRLSATGFAGRLVTDDGPHTAERDSGDFTSEEAAMHLMREQPAPGPVQTRSHADRLDLLEAQVTVLLTMGRIHTEALQTLAEALERLPTEEPDEAAGKVSRAAHNAHDLLLALRGVPD